MNRSLYRRLSSTAGGGSAPGTVAAAAAPGDPASRRPPSRFAQEVYTALCQIPHGRVTTYGALARHIGCRSAQAVGQALSRNPYAPEVPCHRVIRNDLTIGGYSGETSGPDILRKLGLLASEGVTFTDGRLDDPARLFLFGLPDRAASEVPRLS